MLPGGDNLEEQPHKTIKGCLQCFNLRTIVHRIILLTNGKIAYFGNSNGRSHEKLRTDNHVSFHSLDLYSAPEKRALDRLPF